MNSYTLNNFIGKIFSERNSEFRHKQVMPSSALPFNSDNYKNFREIHFTVLHTTKKKKINKFCYLKDMFL